MTYTVRHETRELARPGAVDIARLDPELVAMLEAEWAYHQSHPGEQTVLELKDSKDVTQHASYSRAWGLSRNGTKVNVRKLPVRKGDAENVLRLAMEKHDPNAPKLGRKPAEKTEAPAVPENKPQVAVKK